MSQINTILSKFLPQMQNSFLKNLSDAGKAKLSQDIQKENSKLTLLNQVSPKNNQNSSVLNDLSANRFFKNNDNLHNDNLNLTTNIKSALNSFLNEKSGVNTIKDALSASRFVGSQDINLSSFKEDNYGNVTINKRNVKVRYKSIEYMSQGVKDFVAKHIPSYFYRHSMHHEIRAEVTLEYSSKSQFSAQFSQETGIYTKNGSLTAQNNLSIEAQKQEKFALITMFRGGANNGGDWADENSASIERADANDGKLQISMASRKWLYNENQENYLITQHRANHLSKLKDLYKVEGNNYYVTDYKDSKGRDIVIYVEEKRTSYDNPLSVGKDLGSIASRNLYILNRDTGELEESGYIKKPIEVFQYVSDQKLKDKSLDIPDELYEETVKYLITKKESDKKSGNDKFDEWYYNLDDIKEAHKFRMKHNI